MDPLTGEDVLAARVADLLAGVPRAGYMTNIQAAHFVSERAGYPMRIQASHSVNAPPHLLVSG